MKLKILFVCAIILIASTSATMASGQKLEGAYKFVGLKFPGGQQTEADAKGMIVVHGKYMAFVRSSVGRKSWNQDEPEEEQMKKAAAAFQGLAATAGWFEIEGNTIILHQEAQANPASMGAPSKWEFTLEGKKLTLKPAANTSVEFYFERLP